MLAKQVNGKNKHKQAKEKKFSDAIRIGDDNWGLGRLSIDRSSSRACYKDWGDVV